MHKVKRIWFVVIAYVLAALYIFSLSSCDLEGLLKQGGKKTAILYGITIYNTIYPAGSGPNLSWPVNDVDSMQQLLTEQGWDIISRTDSAATKAQLIADFQSVAQNASAGDRVLFYYSGHGLDQNGYLVPYGAVLPNGTANDQACVSPAELASYSQSLLSKSANLVLILDSCFSGQFVTTGSYATNLPDDLNYRTTADYNSALSQSIANYFNKSSQTGAQAQPNVWVLSAAGIESSYDSTVDPHGAFTDALLHGMNTSNGKYAADYNADGYVTLSELSRYCTEWLNANWNNVDGLQDQYGNDVKFLPHLAGNPLDILLFKK